MKKFLVPFIAVSLFAGFALSACGPPGNRSRLRPRKRRSPFAFICVDLVASDCLYIGG